LYAGGVSRGRKTHEIIRRSPGGSGRFSWLKIRLTRWSGYDKFRSAILVAAVFGPVGVVRIVGVLFWLLV